MSPFTLYLPCESFDVQVTAGSKLGLSPIESLVLRAVAQGMGDFQGLKELFQLGERPMLDLLLGLWQRGHLIIDPLEGTLELPREVREKIEQGQLQDLEGGNRHTATLTLYQERLSGHVLPSLPWSDQPLKGRVVPPTLPEGSWLRASPVELQQAVQQRWRTQNARQAAMTSASGEDLLEYTLPPRRVEGPLVVSKPRHLAVETACSLDLTGRLHLKVVGPSVIPAQLRLELSRALTREAWKQPNLPVFRQAHKEAQTDRSQGEGEVSRSLEQLKKAVRDINPAVLQRAQLRDRHDSLQEQGEDLLGQVQRLLEQEGQGRLLSGEAQGQWLISALKEAQDQLIIASPRVQYSRLSALLPELRSCLSRGVKLVILWGMKRDDSLDSPVIQALEDLGASRGPLLWSPLSSRIRSSFILRDGGELLLPSSPPLAEAEKKTITVGLHFRRGAAEERWIQPEQGASPLHQLLALCERAVPDYRMAERLSWPFVRDEDARDLERQKSQWLKLPLLPRALRDDLEDDNEVLQSRASQQEPTVEAAQRALWHTEWRMLVRLLQERHGSVGPRAELLEGGEHIQHLIHRLEKASSFLVIVTPRITRAALSPSLCKRIQERLNASNLTVVVLSDKHPEEGLEPVLEDLEARGQGRFIFGRLSHAQGMLLDEEQVTVSSFPFLAFDELGQATGRSGTVVGLCAWDPALASSVLETLKSQLPEKRAARLSLLHEKRPAAAQVERSADKVTLESPWGESQQHLAALHPLLGQSKLSASDLEAWVERQGDADSALGALHQLLSLEPAEGTDKQDTEHKITEQQIAEHQNTVERAIAAGLRRYPDAMRGEHGQALLKWLVRRLWHHPKESPRWVMAAALGAQLPRELEPSQDVPLLEVLSLMASYQLVKGPALEEWQGSTWAELRTRATDASSIQTGLLAVAWYGALLHQCPHAWQWLEAAEQLPSVGISSRLVRRLYQAPEITPDQWRLLDPDRRKQTGALLKSAWESARAALADLEKLGFDFKHGQALWLQMQQHPLLEKMKAALSANDIPGIHAALQDWDAQTLTPELVLDWACSQIGAFQVKREGRLVIEKRPQVLRAITKLVDALRAVYSAQKQWDEDEAKRQSLKHQHETASLRAELRSELKKHYESNPKNAWAAPVLRQLLLKLSLHTGGNPS